ncbi:MAG: glycosyltransferase [Gammaproteobacteria bacterium]|nr:glycosyltransferase [Gammaproteobacteria bacterium]
MLLGDGVLAITGWIIKRLQPRQKVVCVVHGLDLIWPARWYQRLWVRRFLPALDGLIAVSAPTRHHALAHGLAAAAITVIPNGIETETLAGSDAREDLARCLGRDVAHTHVLLTAGRLARRKGAAWFIREVLPQLAPNTLYVLAGAGPAFAEIQSAIRDTNLQGRVLLLGPVSDATRNLLLNTVDVFVQPNIPVPGDMEGFGIAVLEAAGCGRPVVAAALEGLLDAITPNENGLLVAPAAARWIATLNALLADPQARHDLGAHAAQYTHQHYHWHGIAGASRLGGTRRAVHPSALPLARDRSASRLGGTRRAVHPSALPLARDRSASRRGARRHLTPARAGARAARRRSRLAANHAAMVYFAPWTKRPPRPAPTSFYHPLRRLRLGPRGAGSR